MAEIGVKNSGLTSMLERQLLGRQAEQTARSSRGEEGSSLSGAAGAQSSSSFLDSLKGAIESANEMQQSSDAAAKNFAAGNGSLHETLIAMEKADLSLRTITAIRGKIIEAYQEVMKMPV